jgi:hypothetical protein
MSPQPEPVPPEVADDDLDVLALLEGQRDALPALVDQTELSELLAQAQAAQAGADRVGSLVHSEWVVDPTQLAARYEAAETINALAKEFHCGCVTMRALLVAGGATIRQPITSRPGRRRRLRVRYPAGTDPHAMAVRIAAQLGADVFDW